MPKFQSLGVIFQFVLLSLACFRIQRIWTADSWFPSEALRNYLKKKADPVHKRGKQNLWTELAELFSCPWCFGAHVTWVVYLIAAQCISIPLPALQAVATMTLVGMLGTYDGSD